MGPTVRHAAALLFALSAATGCPDGETPADAGLPLDVLDASERDAEPIDAVIIDAGSDDTGARDADATDLGRADATDAEPADAEPADAEPADADPAEAGPADADPAEAGPADADPADADPADAGPADADLADAGPAEAGPADAGPVDGDATVLDAAGPNDAQPPDGAADGGSSDAAIADTQPGDASPSDADASAPDAATPIDSGVAPDAGTPDTGTPDAGTTADAATQVDTGVPPDAGVADSGVRDPCSLCHGDETSAAPPQALNLATSDSDRGVGAHRGHLTEASPMFAWHRAVECEDCHIVPVLLADPGHIDFVRPADLTWGAVPSADGASPTFDGTLCTNVYCHGATLSGGTTTSPQWTSPTPVTCGMCHGVPPPMPHPQGGECGDCHGGIAPTGLGFAQPERHIDGVLDLDHLTCISCHGSAASIAPPTDLSGNVSTTQQGVGAHQNHLSSGAWSRTVQCQDCHTVPGHYSDPGHLDPTLPAELTFSALARADGAQPVFDGATCSNTYCHGATLLAGGSNTTPNWTTVDGSQAACGTCHGLPPSSPHPVNADCQACHPTVGAGGNIIDPDRHIDGAVDLDLTTAACNACHGSATTGAPPTDTAGNTATTARGVGAHQAHLAMSTWRGPIECTECHIVPTAYADSGHVDTALPAELTFGGLAMADTATPAFDGASCTNTYCHGATLIAGGSNTAPAWTTVDGSQAACGTCHGLPPAAPHPTSATCDLCHGDVIDPGLVIREPLRHIDGVVDVDFGHGPTWATGAVHGAAVNANGFGSCQACHGAALDGGASNRSCETCHSGWQTDCTFCHGGADNDTGAPPASVAGSTARTDRSVGAHTEHVEDTAIHLPLACERCHVTPVAALSPGHVDGDGRAEVSFDSFNPAGSYDPATGTCASLYCHGNGSALLGGEIWENDPTVGCDQCHAFVGSAPAQFVAMSTGHEFHDNYYCNVCHADVWNFFPARNVFDFVDKSLHIDGSHSVRLNFNGFENAYDGVTCSPPCHAPRPWN